MSGAHFCCCVDGLECGGGGGVGDGRGCERGLGCLEGGDEEVALGLEEGAGVGGGWAVSGF